MVIIPIEQFERIQRENTSKDSRVENNTKENNVLQSTQTIGDNLTRLDDEMKKTLDSLEFSNERDRLKHYIQLLQRYLFFKSENNKPTDILNVQEFEKGIDTDEIIISVPPMYRRKSQLLLNHLNNFKDRFSWDSSGTVTIDGVKIENSNIIDLINFAARYRKTVKPIGRKAFASIIKSTQTPLEFVGNREILNRINVPLFSLPETPKTSKETYTDSVDGETSDKKTDSFASDSNNYSFLNGTILEHPQQNNSSNNTKNKIKKKWQRMKM